MIRWLTAPLAAGLTLFAVGSANATLIWQDGFDRHSSNRVGNNWVEIENDHDDVGIVFGHYLLLRDTGPDGAAAQFGISTLGYENITVEFRWRGWDSETGDSLSFAYQAQPGLSWTTGFVADLGGPETYLTTTVALDPLAADTGALDIAFMIDASYYNDAAKIDYVRIYGDEITGGGGNAVVPEAPTAALFGLALAGLGIAARRGRA